ncbi:hypothetical protein [Sandarakinorhabdus oryzae]|uniref:hypothetical protein n=1 Tax=Sandarakinorhabdus oryzae TaxID=2675220 RepID=UPI0012E10BBC|nr:hypothetical protein [Sandarakinorhabdus oryzae]
MKNATISAALFAAIISAQPVLAQQQTNVTFARGQSSATLNGRIKGSAEQRYVVNARAGQTLTVNFKPTNASAYFNILAPGSSGEAMFVGSTSGNRFSGPVTVSGPHVVQVYLMRSAARRNEVAAYSITIGVTGRGGGGGGFRPSQDALVPGTNYNATAEIPCVTAAGMAKTRCKAGVMRMAMGEATVEIATADGGQRHIYFKNGRASSSDAGNAPMQVTRRGDVSIIRIGRYEVYEIVDAFVVGG